MFSNGVYGSINFDHRTSEWFTFKSRLSEWLMSHDIDDASDRTKEKRKAVLFLALSDSTLKLVCELALPQNIADLDYDGIISLFDDYFTPKPYNLTDRSNFYSAKQCPEETYSQWAARLIRLAAHCGFKDPEENLRDIFVIGMVPGSEREILFEQDLDELTLEKALRLAESMYAAREAATNT